MSSEENPDHGDIKHDISKAKKLRHHTLQLWKSKLGSTTLAKELEPITCQWKGMQLTIYGTRVVDNNRFLSYMKRQVTIPSESGHFAAAAQVLLTMLSLKQQAAINYGRFASILEEKLTTEIETLSHDHGDYLLREDSVERSFESTNSIDEAMDEAAVERNLKRCQEVKAPKDLVSCDNWEKILVDDASHKRKRQRS